MTDKGAKVGKRIDHERPGKPSWKFGLDPTANRELLKYEAEEHDLHHPVILLEQETSRRQGSQQDNQQPRPDRRR